MKLNLATVWNDTYRCIDILERSAVGLEVFTAIHADSGPLLRIEVVTYTDPVSIKSNINLTSEQAEKMAAELLIAARIKREHDAFWAAHRTEQPQEAA